MLKIYNTLSKKKEEFKPIVPNQVGIYVCGVTVYDYCHIGHARTYLNFDMIIRYLQYSGYQVNYIRNITDIDDKIIKRSNEDKEPWQTLTERFIKAMNEDFHEALNTLTPNQEPKATEYVAEMVAMIQELVDKGYAYVAPNKDVYYDVQHFKKYGCLSHRDLDDLIAGARVEVNEAEKKCPGFCAVESSKTRRTLLGITLGSGASRMAYRMCCHVA